jgi:hypothetical protein
MKLKKHDYVTIFLLMKSFINAEILLVISHLIKEILDFIIKYICKKGDALEEHAMA